jgi:hypothetical protein
LWEPLWTWWSMRFMDNLDHILYGISKVFR